MKTVVPRVRPDLGAELPAPRGGALIATGPRRMVFGAPHTPFRFAENHPPAGIPWASASNVITPPAPVPIWQRDDMIPNTPGFEGAPFGPGLEGPAEDFEAIRQQAERVSGRPVPTEAQLRARLGPSFNLARYQESVRRLANLHGYPVLNQDGTTTIYADIPGTSGPSATDQFVTLLEGVKKAAVPIAILAGVLLVLPMLTGGRR